MNQHRDLQNEEKLKATLAHSFELLKVDFEQRSQQILNLTLDRSKFLRLSILVWSAPLVISAAVIEKKSIEELFVSTSIIGLISLCFYFCTLINFVVFVLTIHNWNTIRISISGVNYIRSLYFHLLQKHSIIDVQKDEILSKVVSIKEGNPKFKVVNSKSNNILLYAYSIVNSFYALIGYLSLYQIGSKLY